MELADFWSLPENDCQTWSDRREPIGLDNVQLLSIDVTVYRSAITIVVYIETVIFDQTADR